jgi:hypothetical protein
VTRRRMKRRYRAKSRPTISVTAAAHAAIKVIAESQNKSMRQVVEEWVEEVSQ